jgi:anthranilate phosphoribosyltransferase
VAPIEPEEREVDLTLLLEKVADGQDLTAVEAEDVFDGFMTGAASEIQMAGLLVGLRAKGVHPLEVAGGVRALRKAMVPVPADDPSSLVDTAGTGGGGITTFNISTAAALVAAGAGVRLAKHGNRSFTSRSGSADVLEAMGVRIDLRPERMGEILAEEGIVFMFAPLLHPAMRHVGPVRRGLGITTVMNILGPLTNPAGARRQVMGVADPRLLDLVAGALAALRQERALVVHGEAGMDEISPCGTTQVAEVAAGSVVRYEVSPESLGLEEAPLSSLAGGEPGENADVIRRILAGKGGGPRTATLLNAAAAIYVSGRAESLADGAVQAAASIEDGRAADALERLRAATHRS